MINWHRRMWKVAGITNAGVPSHPLLYKESGSNVFWLDPKKKSGKTGPDTFTVHSLPEAMTKVWKNRELLVVGTEPLALDAEPDESTERLESEPFKVAGLVEKHILRVYLAPDRRDPQHAQCLLVSLVDADGDATAGIAAGGNTGHPP